MNAESDEQQKIMQFQMLQNNLKVLEEKERMIMSALDELERTKMALEDLKNCKGDTYIPLGASNFVLGKIEDNQNVLVSIGSGLAVKMPREDAIKDIGEKTKELDTESKKISLELQKVSNHLIKLQTEIEALRQ